MFCTAVLIILMLITEILAPIKGREQGTFGEVLVIPCPVAASLSLSLSVRLAQPAHAF